MYRTLRHGGTAIIAVWKENNVIIDMIENISRDLKIIGPSESTDLQIAYNCKDRHAIYKVRLLKITNIYAKLFLNSYTRMQGLPIFEQ